MFRFIPLSYHRLDHEEEIEGSRRFLELCRARRSVRHFSSDPVSLEVIENAIRTAGTAPSGANKQPWKFVLVSDADIKSQIRAAAEAEEKESYERRMPNEWLEDLEPLGTDWHKPFLEIGPYILVVFREDYRIVDGKVRKNYYVSESVGIAVGFLLAAIHQAGLVALTHTPSPMGFLNEILGRPKNEKPFLVMPIGYPAAEASVPDIQRKPLEDILIQI
jgi:iodotyrosine deiodinase